MPLYNSFIYDCLESQIWVLNFQNLKLIFPFCPTCKSAAPIDAKHRQGGARARPPHAGAPSRPACGHACFSPVQRLLLQMASL
jgi:hypothetical protein